jgi:hypothetical protein
MEEAATEQHELPAFAAPANFAAVPADDLGPPTDMSNTKQFYHRVQSQTKVVLHEIYHYAHDSQHTSKG